MTAKPSLAKFFVPCNDQLPRGMERIGIEFADYHFVRFEPDVSAIEGVVRGLRCKKQQLISRATSRGWRRRRTSKCTQAEYARRVISASRSRVRRRSKAGKEKARRRARRSRGEGSRPPGHRDPCLHAIKFGWYFNVSSQGPPADIIRGHALNGFPCSIVSMS